MTDRCVRFGLAMFLVTIVAAAGGAVSAAQATDCGSLLGLFQQGRSTVEIARISGLSSNEVRACHRELSQPIFVGPEGAPPLGAAGPPPRNAAGPPPLGAAGPPPLGAAGPPPFGAAGPPPLGAAGPPPLGREVKRLP